jgi:hypothetical protein
MTTDTKIDTRKFVALLTQRKKDDGSAWYCEEDIASMFPGIDNKTLMGHIIRTVRMENDLEPERLAKPEKMIFARKLLAETNGEVTPEVAALWKEKFGQDSMPGPIRKSVRVYMGLEDGFFKNTHPGHKKPKEEEVAVTPELREALNMVKHVEEIQREINQIDRNIDDLKIDREKLQVKLDHYKPVMAQLRALGQAVTGVRNKAQELV